jgi:hypothetical protein
MASSGVSPSPDLNSIATSCGVDAPKLLLPVEVLRELAADIDALKRMLPPGQKKDRTNTFFNLCLQINEGEARAKAVLGIYRLLDSKVDKIKKTVGTGNLDLIWTDLLALNVPDLPCLQTFMGERPCSMEPFLDLLIKVGARRSSLLHAMIWTVQCLDVDFPPTHGTPDFSRQGRLGGIRTETAEAIALLASTYPLRGGFAGFAAWGTGNHSSPSSNLLWHFMKHVLGSAEDGQEAYPQECAWWWQRLGISLNKNQLNLTDEEATITAGMFAADGRLVTAKIPDFIETSVLIYKPILISQLVSQYQPIYRDEAINGSAHMTQVAISVAENKILVSGVAGELFIVGRLDPSDNTLKISSCYQVQHMAEKVSGRKQVLLWYLTNG